MNKIIVYGDSNTYGYDPRGMMGERYPLEIRWTTLLGHAFAGTFEVVNEGLNGRQLPAIPRGLKFLESRASDLKEGDILLVMLGTNDILLTSHPDAAAPLDRMEKLLDWYDKTHRDDFRMIIIGPVPMADSPEDMVPYHEESLKMNEGFASLCKAHNIDYIDSASWNIPLAYDGVHLSEEGLPLFASALTRELRKIL